MSFLNTVQNNLDANSQTLARVFHGRGNCYPGLEHINVEWYPPYLLVQNFGGSTELIEQDLTTLFAKRDEIEAILIQSRVWPDFTAEIRHQRRELELPIKFFTPLRDKLVCEITLGKNRNTGVFCDMKAGWDWISKNAKNKRVLNQFCYTSIFSLFALDAGANKVDNVDMAANVLKISQRNHEKNGLHEGRAGFYKRDLLKSDRWFEGRDKYDIIIMDPPPYQKKAFTGWKDYQKLIRDSLVCLETDGQLLLTLNNPTVTINEFTESLDSFFEGKMCLEKLSLTAEIEEAQRDQGLKLVVASRKQDN